MATDPQESRVHAVPTVSARGASIPALGLGTWKLEGDVARATVETALELGYRHVDTARVYGNEAEIGRALAAADVRRSEIFLVTKIWPDDYAAPQFGSALDDSLEGLDVDHVDLLLLHWPRFDRATLEESVESLLRARESGRTRHVGVSNFNSKLLERADRVAGSSLVANQVEYHPLLSQASLLETVRGRDMALTAYCPLANGRVVRGRGGGIVPAASRWLRSLLKGPRPGQTAARALARIGEAHGKTSSQVALRWLTQQKAVVAIPRSSDPSHLRENMEIFDFRLSPEEMRTIGELTHMDERLFDPPDLAPEWDDPESTESISTRLN